MRNTNMRSGFTIIELIYVIVIIGILAAVAIPKLAGTATEAKKSNYISFMGTLNRTVGPAMWAEAVAKTDGKVATMDIGNYTQLPKGLESLALTNCAANPSTTALIEAATADTGLPKKFKIYCKEGTPTSAPQFGFDANATDVNATFKYSE